MMTYERAILVMLFLMWSLNAAALETGLETQGGRTPAKNLKMKSSKVPTFEIHKAGGSLPRLDIGEEPRMTFRDPALNIPAAPQVRTTPVRKDSVAVVDFDLKKLNLPAFSSMKSVANTKDPGSAPEVKSLSSIDDPETKASEVSSRKIKPLSTSEEKVFEAQILLEHHDSPETSLGLLVDLLDDKEVQTEARFTYALAARKLGLGSEFRSMLMKIALEGKNKDWAKRATETLAQEVEALDISDMKVLHELVSRYEIETDKNDAYNFYRAKYFLESGDLGQVEDAIKYISEKSKYHSDALLISALSAYRIGKIDRAADELAILLKTAEKNTSLHSIGALTLARIQFQKGEYKEAFKTYLEVDRNSALWLQAMVEQAWTQVLTQDYEGAAGNMFSLHTDFFKNAFAPESYTLRSVAYLNLCQFGDGMQVLNSLGKKYGPLVVRLEKYKAEKKAPQDDYDTVRTWLKNTDLKEVAGLPRSFIVELARHPSFMKVQNQINQFEDELERFNKANLSLIQREKDLLRRQNEVKESLVKIKELHSKGSNVAESKVRMDNAEADLASLQRQYDLAKKARGLIKEARTRSAARIDKEKVQLKEKASQALRARLNVLVADLTHVLEQNEVVQYEIMSGAGEHLRAQSAGAENNAKDSAAKQARKPADDKSVKWSFKGEIWEDEVGHYRSSLKNVCTKDEQQMAAY